MQLTKRKHSLMQRVMRSMLPFSMGAAVEEFYRDTSHGEIIYNIIL